MKRKRQKKIEHITDREIFEDILEQLSKGVSPWRMPWTNSLVVIGSMKYLASNWPSNVRAPLVPFGLYNGILLLTHARVRGYRTNLWVAERVVKQLGVALDSTDKRSVEIRSFAENGNRLGKRHVYNIDQVSDCEKTLGLSLEIVPSRPIEPTKRYEKSRELLDSLKADRNLRIVYHSYAAYAPSFDVIMMPVPEQFKVSRDGSSGDTEGMAHYWATLWHEVVHWTGHPSRLNRDRHKEWGDEIYAFEELVAELGSAFLCAHLKIEGKLQHANYLDHWYKQLKTEQNRNEDPAKSSLMTASILASEAKYFVLNDSTQDFEDQPLSPNRE